MWRSISEQPWHIKAFEVLMIIVFGVSMAAASWALFERFTQTNERRATQMEINRQFQEFKEEQERLNRRIRQVSQDYCDEIEKLKTARRAQANDAWANRARNLRLLGVPMTAEVIEVMRQERARVLARFRPEDCPRPAMPIP